MGTMEVESSGVDMQVSSRSTKQGAPKPICLLRTKLPTAAELLFSSTTEEKKLYWDRSHYDSPESQMRALGKSSTLYIGNLAFSTRSAIVWTHFRQIGPIRAVHMGLDRFMKTPCGFCFVEYYRRKDALQAVANLSGSKLDGRIIRVELDAGFQPGRQYGRGASGGQVRDDRRGRSDPARARRSKELNWTPPDQVQRQQQQQQQPSNEPTSQQPPEDTGKKETDVSYYGSGVKQEPDNEQDADMGDRSEKNPRFRED